MKIDRRSSSPSRPSSSSEVDETWKESKLSQSLPLPHPPDPMPGGSRSRSIWSILCHRRQVQQADPRLSPPSSSPASPCNFIGRCLVFFLVVAGSHLSRRRPSSEPIASSPSPQSERVRG
ncbi:unnamed protein product [Linum trigynum]|uniref:Uncharacterized protein n=1 Tax=Linum trigynum TaxID=586398 RepID=A0AAV2FWI8_9ROSI